MRSFITLISIFLVLETANSAAVTFPPYFKRCPKKPEIFEKCAISASKDMIPHLVEGIKEFGIPPLDPLNLPLIQLETSNNLELNLTDIEVFGLKGAVLKEIHLDLDNRVCVMDIFVDNVTLHGHYTIKGKIVILPIEGDGPSVFKFIGGLYQYRFHYDLYEKNGVDYAKFKSHSFEYKLKKAQFFLDNLFGGDKVMGAQVSTFLNENWEDVLKDFGNVIKQTISTLCKQIATNFFNKIPFDAIFDG